jgi:hypothetical protein
VFLVLLAQAVEHDRVDHDPQLKSLSSRPRFFRISTSLRWISTLMVSVLFTLPRPLQYGQSSYTA